MRETSKQGGATSLPSFPAPACVRSTREQLLLHLSLGFRFSRWWKMSGTLLQEMLCTTCSGGMASMDLKKKQSLNDFRNLFPAEGVCLSANPSTGFLNDLQWPDCFNTVSSGDERSNGAPSLMGEYSVCVGTRENHNKRKGITQVADIEDDSAEKKIKGCMEARGLNSIRRRNTVSSGTSCSSKNEKQASSAALMSDMWKTMDERKSDYIHVRARRGQATDSHSLAERARREKISERMKHLQDLVPGCHKVAGKAGMLDEIINYVKSLQQQVEFLVFSFADEQFLSMKLVTLNPTLDFDVETLLPKEAPPASSLDFSVKSNPTYLPFNPQEQQLSANAPRLVPDAFRDSSCFPQSKPFPTWDADLHSVFGVEFDQGRC